MGINAGELSIFKVETTANTFVALTGVLSIDGPEISQAEVDTTTIGAAGAKTKRPSKKYEVGPISVEFLFNSQDAVHDFLVDNSTTALVFGIEEITEDTSKFAGDVFISNISFGGSEDEGNFTCTCEFTFSGAVTYTPDAA